MPYALTLSLLLNVALLIVTVRLYRRRGGRPLPRRQPDFDRVEAAVRKCMAQPQIAAKIQLANFKTRTWLCQTWIVDVEADADDTYEAVRNVVHQVRQQCDLPGRVAGHWRDRQKSQLETGHIIEFGYSREVGYRHRNEFHETDRASA